MTNPQNIIYNYNNIIKMYSSTMLSYNIYNIIRKGWMTWLADNDKKSQDAR